MRTKDEWNKVWKSLLEKWGSSEEFEDPSVSEFLFLFKVYVDRRFDEIKEILDTEILPNIPHE